MFGVLAAEDAQGERVWLHAFSSLPGGERELPGWVPPTLGAGRFDALVKPGELEIKALSAALAETPKGSGRWRALRAERRARSRSLWATMLDAYRLRSVGGVERPLRELSLRGDQIPSGTGECCAPKLLSEAARRGLRPRAMVEFSWGRRGEGGLRWAPGTLRASCEARCGLILGFMLCPHPDEPA